MHFGKTRYVAACQQLLTLGVVVAALVPAASVVTLDVVRETPTGAASGGTSAVTAVAPAPTGALAAYTKAALTPSQVATAPTDAAVKEVQLTAPATTVAGRRAVGAAAPGSTTRNARKVTHAKRTVITSTPQAITGYGTVGVTWQHGDTLQPSQIRVRLRTEKNGVWSRWKKVDYDVDGPDGTTAEGRRSRPGTMEALIGHVDRVQVRMAITGAKVPPDMQLAVITPGQAPTAMERAAIDTSTLDTAADDAGAVDATTGASTDPAPGTDQVTLSAASIITPKPQIYSRAQWGADEKIREQTAPGYAEVHGGFVHHTVNANDYTAAEVPGILRSIYAYHVKSRGWRDIGYNFLIDKFGRIWEGRYGGVDRPVVGAHTENYNDYGFGVSAIGNFEIAKPTDALIQAEGALFAWKLSLHGVSAAATNVKIGAKVFASSIMGHRDTKSTACPGKYLYARIPDIRKLAASLQKGWSGRALQSSFVGSADPDLVMRNATTKEVYVVPTGVSSSVDLAQPVTVSTGIGGRAQAVISPDLTGDGRADLVQVARNGRMTLKAGDGLGHFGTVARRDPKGFVGRSLLTSVGDLNGDRRNDLVARIDSGKGAGKLAVYLGRGNGTFKRVARPMKLTGALQIVAPGDVTGDGKPDLLVRTATTMTLYRGNGAGRFAAGTPVTGVAWSSYNAVVGAGDITGDGKPDLLARDAAGNGWVLPGNGAGGFGKAIGPIAGLKSLGRILGTAPVTGRRLPDVVGRTGATLQVVAGQTGSAGGLGSPIDTGLNLPNAVQLMNAGDWNRDGNSDLISLNTDGNLYLYLGNGQGRFSAPTLLASGFGGVTLLSAPGDITGDGYPDLQGQVNGAMRIWPGRGAAGLAASYVSHSAISAKRQVAAGLWTADGAPDSIFLSAKATVLYPGNGPGGLTNPVTIGGGINGYSWVIGVSNMRGTGKSALIVRDTGGSLYEIDPTSTGMLGTPQLLGTGYSGYDLAG